MVQNPLPTRKHFRKENVIVTIPARPRPVSVVRLDLPDEQSMRPVPGGFQPFRLVINLKVVDAAQPDSEVSVFDPPIEVRVHCTADDLARATAIGKPLSLGFWDGRQWIRFTPEKHQFHLEPEASPAKGGWGVVNISHWGDPTKAWGT
jgi:hypothetical protein